MSRSQLYNQFIAPFISILSESVIHSLLLDLDAIYSSSNMDTRLLSNRKTAFEISLTFNRHDRIQG